MWHLSALSGLKLIAEQKGTAVSLEETEKVAIWFSLQPRTSRSTFLDKSAGATKQRGPETRQRLRLSLYWYGGFSQKNETRDKQNLVKKNRKPRKKPIIYMENLKKKNTKIRNLLAPALYDVAQLQVLEVTGRLVRSNRTALKNKIFFVWYIDVSR